MFNDFLPKHLTNLVICDKKTNKRTVINAQLIVKFYNIGVNTSVIVYNELQTKRMIVIPYSIEEMLNVFTVGIIEDLK